MRQAIVVGSVLASVALGALTSCGAHEAPATVAVEAGVAAGLSYSIGFGPVTVQPGEEHTKCIVARLGNTLPVHIGSLHDVLSTGSHHMIVYRSNETVEQTTPFDCKPFTDTLDPTKGSTLVVSQKHDDLLSLPPGVAFTLDANQMIRLEVHYLNPGSAPIDVTATANFVTMDDASFHDEAGFLFVGDPDIKLPPHAATTLGPVFFTVPPGYEDAHFFAITGHEHQMGTNVSVAVATSASDPGTSVYDVPGWLWSEPATVAANPTFQIPPGGGFRFTCDWNNTSDKMVRFGESANDEMCFFWAYYYPSQGSRVCFHSTQVGGGIDVCCPGPSLFCPLFVQATSADGG